MLWSLTALVLGFCLDQLLGDPHAMPHPVTAIGWLVSRLEKLLRRLLPKSAAGERTAGGILWVLTVGVATGIPALLLWLCHQVSPWLRLAAETWMMYQLLAARSLQDESMKVYHALTKGTLAEARQAVSQIVGRDVQSLDEEGVAKAAVETVAENTSDGVVAPLLYAALGGAALGWAYKAVNTMDSMLGYVEEPYRNVGFLPAKLDDVWNYIPARLSALLMLLAGVLLGYSGKKGWQIYRRDRRCHASPNSAQTESVCAGLLEVRLAGDAWYHGVLHTKPTIGDPIRPVTAESIPQACRLMRWTAVISLVFCLAVGLLLAAVL